MFPARARASLASASLIVPHLHPFVNNPTLQGANTIMASAWSTANDAVVSSKVHRTSCHFVDLFTYSPGLGNHHPMGRLGDWENYFRRGVSL
jgi:hypothetical protein